MPLSEVSLKEMKLLARQFAHMEESEFISESELTQYINDGVAELYDLLTTYMGQEYFLKTATVQLEGKRTLYELPDDIVTVKGVDWSRNTTPPKVDVDSTTDGGGTTTVVTTTYDVPIDEHLDVVPLLPYSFRERNADQINWDPNYSSSTNDRRYESGPKYRILSSTRSTNTVIASGGELVSNVTVNDKVNLIRLSDEATGFLTIWYVPEVPRLVNPEDSIADFHGFESYPSLVAATMMLAKEESDTGAMMARRNAVKKRIETMASIRDVSHPEQITDVGGY